MNSVVTFVIATIVVSAAAENGPALTADDCYSDDAAELLNPCNYDRCDYQLPEIERTGRRITDIKCDQYMWQYKIEVLDAVKYAEKCAKKVLETTGLTSITHGVIQTEVDFPHMGAIGWLTNDGGIKWMCWGALISPRFVLAPARCKRAYSRLPLQDIEPKMVRFGRSLLETEKKYLPAIDVEIENFLVPDEYTKRFKYNDIGLIKLKEEVQMNPHIKPACLNVEALGNTWIANVTGWGVTLGLPNTLTYAEVDFVDKNTCKRYLDNFKNRRWLQGLKDDQLCAGKLRGGKDTTLGGTLEIRRPMPMADTTSVVHQIVGISNFAVRSYLPGVYTNVTSFLCWIEKTVWPEEINPFCP